MFKIFLASWVVIGSLYTTSGWSKNFVDSVQRMRWGDMEVVWIEDDKFPKFSASFYIQDGSLSDQIPGLTQATFDQFQTGTKQETQREIAEFFDFYGARVRHSVTHEYSVLSIQALVKDIKPVMGKVCELFREAQYPEKELKSYASRAKSHLKNLVTSHSALADRVFRQVSLTDTPYIYPVEGTLESFDKLKPQMLRERLNTLAGTKKTLYLAGPAGARQLEKIVSTECGWSNKSELKAVELSKPSSQSAIYLVPVPGANQAQIRIGRYMINEEVKGKYDHFNFLSGFLGGGFTSKLVQELRVKRGYTYSASAYVSMQRDYGRAGIMTFSKNETTAPSIALIREILQEVGSGKFDEQEFKHQQGHKIGGYAFGFEETGAFLAQLMLYDHQGRKLSELARFPETIAALKSRDLAQASQEAFPWERMTIVVVGDKSLEQSLSRIRPVRILNYNDFL
jgi:zinc protease